jgi:Fe-S-cluster containining protein
LNDVIALLHTFEGLNISSKWNELLDLYNDVDTNSALFTSSLGIRCPPACGTCCEHFIPDLTTHEASLIAAYMMFIKKDLHLISLIDPNYNGQGCPLYNKDDPYHCQIYPVRSLVCRLFGAAPSKTKYDMPIFRKCKYNHDESQKKVIESDEIHEKIRDVQTMQDASGQLNSLLIETNKELLPIAVSKAMKYLTLISSYLTLELEELPLDRPDPSSPVAV